MKNIILILFGFCMLIYTLLCGFQISSLQIRKNEIEKCVSRVLEENLSKGYQQEDEETVRERMIEELTQCIRAKGYLTILFPIVDMEKGIISVQIKEEYSQPNGKHRTIEFEKTALVERTMIEKESVTITFLVDEEVYKEYCVKKGEVCPNPKVPSRTFAGWVEYGDSSNQLIQNIGNVWEDKVYVAMAN